MVPNSMLAPFSLQLEPGDEASLRAYLPCVPYMHHCTPEALLEHEVSGVALVALRPLQDGDELLFNYRLSPGFGRPSWYTAVDEQEADRRWA